MVYLKVPTEEKSSKIFKVSHRMIRARRRTLKIPQNKPEKI